jgi:hypothetical protein
VACVFLLILNIRIIRIFSVHVPLAFWLLIPVDRIILRKKKIEIKIKIIKIIIFISNIASSSPALIIRIILDIFIDFFLRGVIFWLSFDFLLLATLKIPV